MQVTFAVQGQHGEQQHHHACRFTPNLQYHSIVEAISTTQSLSIRVCLVEGKAPLLFGSTWSKSDAECWSTGAPWSTEQPSFMLAYSHMRYCTPGVGLQQDISTAGLQSQGYLHAEALGCQCKGYLGRSPLLCRITTVNGTTIMHAGTSAVQHCDGVRKRRSKLDAECWMAMRKHLVYSKVYPPYASTV